MCSSCLAPCAHRSLPKTAFRIPPEVPPGLVAVVRDNRSMHVLHAPVFAGRGSHNLPVSIAGEVGGGGSGTSGRWDHRSVLTKGERRGNRLRTLRECSDSSLGACVRGAHSVCSFYPFLSKKVGLTWHWISYSRSSRLSPAEPDRAFGRTQPPSTSVLGFFPERRRSSSYP